LQNLGKKSSSEASSNLKSGARREQYEKVRSDTSTAQKFEYSAGNFFVKKTRNGVFAFHTIEHQKKLF